MRYSLPHARGYSVLLMLSVLLGVALFVPIPRTVKAQQSSTRQLTQEGAEKQSGRRIALVIGNSAYTNTPRLKNPANDATDIAAALSKLGFTVESGVDLSQKQMKFMIRAFGQKLKAGWLRLTRRRGRSGYSQQRRRVSCGRGFADLVAFGNNCQPSTISRQYRIRSGSRRLMNVALSVAES